MSQSGIPARRTALFLLDRIMENGRLMSELIGAGALDRLSPEDRARAQRLANDTLRGVERADRLLQKHLQKYPPLPVRNALRLGTIELCAGGAAHGVVNDIVSIVSRDKRHGRLKGLVNAVLRKIAAEGPEAWDELRAPRLPKWLRGPLAAAWGPTPMSAIERAHLRGAPLDLTPKGDGAALAEAVGGTLLPTGSVRVAQAGQVTAMPGYDAGDWWVQDAAAALPAKVLAPSKGERVLDLCAAPGGKTMQLAAMGASITAVDDNDGRMARVRENLARTQLSAEIIVSDAREVTGTYNAILLDAPCSATGTIRRHPDLPFAKDGSDFAALMSLQAELIDHAWSLLPKGGRLVFCTCSLLPDEGEVQTDAALVRHADMIVDRAALKLPGIETAWITQEGGLRLRPDYWEELGGMDGFYMVCLRKG